MSYSKSTGSSYDTHTGRRHGQTFKSSKLDPSLDPKLFRFRECANTDEHPNTIPVILALDVTGSMGQACSETAATLGIIITNLYEKFKDIEFCVMGIGDLSYDQAPIQMSQFESDVRIAVALDKIWIEYGGGGNMFESYTAAWYMGLYRTKLDCYDQQGRKGIIITMGDEPLNPYLPATELNNATNATEQESVETAELYRQASEKFDIFHIAVNSSHNMYSRYAQQIQNSFGKLLGPRYKVANLNELSIAIEDCITESIQNTGTVSETRPDNGNGVISW